jgi:putative transposase
MECIQAYKFELMPTGGQCRLLRRYAGACRFVFNKGLALQKESRAAGNGYIGYVEMAKKLTAWRHDPETIWLQEAPCHPLQHALKRLEAAFKNYFAKRTGFPVFKRKGWGDSFRYPDSKQIKLDQGNSRIFLPKLGWLRYRKSRGVLGEVRNVTVSCCADKWFVAIQTRREVGPCLPAASTAIGIDVGIARFATMSDATFIEATNSYKKHQRRLARYQRRMSRKIKFGKNWKKARARVQKLHSRIANLRKDILHRASTTICKKHAVVCVEDLKIGNMVRPARGTMQQPGRMVSRKSALNRGILDQGWGEFRRQLEYKLAWRRGILLAVSPHHTSQTCPECGHVSKDNRRTQSKFSCVACGYENHADVVGAINILERGLRLFACGERAQSGRSMKQEPTDSTLARLR